MYKERIASCGERIAEALLLRGLKQCDLCEKSGVPKSSLSLYLKGAYEPKQDRIYSMAIALNVSEAWLMGYDVPMERNDNSPIIVSEEDKKFYDLLSTMTQEEKDLFYGIIQSIIERRK